MDIIAELANPATIGTGNKYDVLLITERTDIIDTTMWEHTNSLLRHYHNQMLTGNALLQIAWESVNAYLINYTPKSMNQCRDIIENQVCDSYFTFIGRPEQINNCKTWISNNSTWQTNPFNWPDNNLIVW